MEYTHIHIYTHIFYTHLSIMKKQIPGLWNYTVFCFFSIFGSFCKILSDAFNVKYEDPFSAGYFFMTRIIKLCLSK